MLLSPILARWGLELTFDDEQAAGRRSVTVDGAELPVNLPGRFERVANVPGDICRLSHEGLVARCRVGRGNVTAIADAALFEPPDAAQGEQDRRAALAALGAMAW